MGDMLAYLRIFLKRILSKKNNFISVNKKDTCNLHEERESARVVVDMVVVVQKGRGVEMDGFQVSLVGGKRQPHQRPKSNLKRVCRK
jgi:hypothetical protein